MNLVFSLLGAVFGKDRYFFGFDLEGKGQSHASLQS